MGHRILCNGNLVKISEDEGDFIRATRRCVPKVHTYPCGRTWTQGTSCNAKAITERIIPCGCLVLIFRCMFIYGIDVVDVLDK